MPGIGETLREARDAPAREHRGARGSRTKIRAKYLRALENEEFGLLPGPTYVKSFLRTYAEKLGLDAAAARRGVPGAVRAARAGRVPADPLAAARPAAGAAAGAALRPGCGDRRRPRSRCSVFLLDPRADRRGGRARAHRGPRPAKTEPRPSRSRAGSRRGAAARRDARQSRPRRPTSASITVPTMWCFEGMLSSPQLPRESHDPGEPRASLRRAAAERQARHLPSTGRSRRVRVHPDREADPLAEAERPCA